MSVPLAVGKLNRVGFNHLPRPVARHLPGFGVVHHRGRKSGREVQTPVNLFRTESGFIIPARHGLRPVERVVLGWLAVAEFLALDRASDGDAAGARGTVGT